MAGKKQSDFLKKEELIRLVSLHSDVDPTNVRKVLRSFPIVIKEVMLKGYKVSVNGVGYFTHKYIKPTEDRDWYNPKMQKKVPILGHPGYNFPKFVWAAKLKDEMRELTEGNPFDTINHTEDSDG